MLKKVISGAAIVGIAVGGLIALGGQAFADTTVVDGVAAATTSTTLNTTEWTWVGPKPGEWIGAHYDWGTDT